MPWNVPKMLDSKPCTRFTDDTSLPAAFGSMAFDTSSATVPSGWTDSMGNACAAAARCVPVRGPMLKINSPPLSAIRPLRPLSW